MSPTSATERRPRRHPRGARRASRATAFTLLEVLVAMVLLSITLVTLYQTFASTIYLLRANRSGWKAMIYANNELMRLERQPQLTVSVSQGVFPAEDPMAGYSWKREIKDEEPIPGVQVRKVELTMVWVDGTAQRSFRSHIYVPVK